MIVTILYSIILVSALIVIIPLFLQHQKHLPAEQQISMFTVLFAGWLISAVFFGPEFFGSSTFDVGLETPTEFQTEILKAMGYVIKDAWVLQQ